MKTFILFISLCIISVIVTAQVTKFAVVRPNGTTNIFSSLDAAYDNAISGDAIYLPGGLYYLSYLINKEVHMYGAGISPDSTQVTNRTIIASGNPNFNSQLYFLGGAGSTFEGIVFSQYISLSSGNISFKRCHFNNTLNCQGYSNFLIEECIIDGQINSINSSIIKKNVIQSYGSNGISFCDFTNNIFIGCWFSNTIHHSTLSNNIFLCGTPIVGGSLQSYSNTYNNNLKLDANPPLSTSSSDVENGTLFSSSSLDIFVNHPNITAFSFYDDLHLKATCVGKNAGTDGTDLGIYGTNKPVPEGWVPSNPHIFYKNVASESNNDGKLPIHFKVRSGN